jgi:thiol-disulfide isomerase/thioredoxin
MKCMLALLAAAAVLSPTGEKKVYMEGPRETLTLQEVLGLKLDVVRADGTPAPLDSMIGSGRPVVIELWATWCAPCLKLAPRLADLHEKYAAQGLSVVALSVEDPATSLDKVARYAREHEVPYAVGFASTELRRALTGAEQVGVPKVFVFGADGALDLFLTGYGPSTGGKVASAVRRAMKEMKPR